MSHQEGVLSFMDILDLDEEVIDTRLKSIMDRNSYTEQHLRNALHLLKYKDLINIRDGVDCENEAEYHFIAKLLSVVQEENIDDICRIIKITLSLDKSTIVSKSEHLIQQILSNIAFPSQKRSDTPGDHAEEENSAQILLNFKLCDSILDTVIKYSEKLSLPFLDAPLEKVLATSEDKLKIYFLNNTVPKLFKAVVGYNILDRIWNYMKQYENCNYNALKTLSCLAEYYLPVADKQGNIKYDSQIITHYEFWDILLNGLMSDDPATRKISVYLIKRSIDNIISLNKDLHISSRTEKIFTWQNKNCKLFKENWDNFFILIDSLEEKQSNIVLPSLQLFETIESIGNCWLSCAFNIGLKHDNTQVRFRCIEHRLKTRIKNVIDATVLLEALNDIHLYDHPNDCSKLRHKLSEAFNDRITFVSIIKAVPKINWSPIPLYHISEILAEENVELSSIIDHKELFQITRDLLNIACNNLPIRYAFKINVTYFVGQCCKGFHWRDFINIYSMVDWEKTSGESVDRNPFIVAIKNLNLNLGDKQEFFDIICSSHATINLGLIYLENHTADLNIFLENIVNKIKKIQDIGNRQYSNKSDCLNEVIFVTHLLHKTKHHYEFQNTIAMVLSRECKTITRYIFSLAQSRDANLSIEDMNTLFKGYESMAEIDDYEVRTLVLDIYRKMTIILTNKESDIAEKLFAISIVRVVTKKLYPLNKQKMFNLKQMLHIMKHMNVKETSNTIDIGRFRNAFYEKSCEILHKYMEIEEDSENVKTEDLDDKKSQEIVENLSELVEFVEKVMERGGYGCLKWVLKMMNAMLPEILKSNCVKINVFQFLDRFWKEIEELKSNNQYSPCMQQFVRLITQDSLLNKALYNNIIIMYCSKIVEYGTLKNSPLLFLVYELNQKDISEDHGQIMHILCDILLFSPVPKKDHRIADNVALEILQNPKYSLDQSTVDIYFNSDIQYTVIMTLSRIKYPAIFKTIATLIISKIDDHFKMKQRYHGNSQSHRLLLIGLQHLLFLPLLNQKVLESEHTFSWVIELLGKIPHQPSVKICLEWFITQNFYVKNVQMDQSVIELMKSKNVPLTSQFMILYWILKHRISNHTVNLEEFKFVMDFLLSHTMGQMFNLRLHAQFLATELFKKFDMNLERYTYIIEVIRKTFVESAKDKNFVRLEEDFFVKEFDIVGHFTPVFIYYFLPRYCDIGINEKVDKKYLNGLFQCVNKTVAHRGVNSAFHREWLKMKQPDEDILFKYDFNKSKDKSDSLENYEAIGTIQKKYIPWKNMNDIDAFETVKKREAVGELILVASLIDKLPNLGGMARTSEVFGVNTYVVDSLRHLQDKVFQGLSVSAERWVNIDEVRPGPPLKDYLIKKKAEGYTVVAAEQTSTSIQLQKFRFPKKTLLLLGHEKGGIPCDLLPMMDQCVEIPQQGFVRSLNVHVTAAIFVWEYSRQIILS